jgi:hypothetical protein
VSLENIWQSGEREREREREREMVSDNTGRPRIHSFDLMINKSSMPLIPHNFSIKRKRLINNY